MQLLNFIIISLLFVAAGNIALKTLYKMIQPDGALDVMFGWQNKLDKWYGKSQAGSKFHRWLHDAMGGCAMCTSFWFMPIWIIFYIGFCKIVLGWFITDYAQSLIGKCFVAFTWLMILQFIGSSTGLLLLMFKKKRK